MSRDRILTDEQWALIEPLLPSSKGKRSRPFRDHRQVIEGIVFRYRTGCPWRDVPERFGPWKTLWKRHARFSKDGTWDRILERLLVQADADGKIDWQLALDSTISRVHQHAATLPREVAVERPSHTGGRRELQETACRAG
jgi:transposase